MSGAEESAVVEISSEQENGGTTEYHTATIDNTENAQGDESMDTSQAVEQSDSNVDDQPASEQPVEQTSEEDRSEFNSRVKLFVGGLSFNSTEVDITEYFQQYSQSPDVNLKYDAETGKSRCFAFVVVESPEVLDKILQVEKHEIGGRTVDCKKALPPEKYKAQKHRTKKVFVGGVPIDMEKEILEPYFAKFGDIEEVALVTEKGDKTKRRGFIFVTYVDFESVDKCTEKSFHEIEDAEGKNVQVEVKRATPRDDPGFRGGPMMSGRGSGMARGGVRRGGMQPYGGGAVYGGYGFPGGASGYAPYGEYYEPYYGGPAYYGGGGGRGFHGDRGGGGPGYARYGPMKGNQGGSKGYHPYPRY